MPHSSKTSFPISISKGREESLDFLIFVKTRYLPLPQVTSPWCERRQRVEPGLPHCPAVTSTLSHNRYGVSGGHVGSLAFHSQVVKKLCPPYHWPRSAVAYENRRLKRDPESHNIIPEMFRL